MTILLSVLITTAALTFLIAVNALYVAAEFSAVSIRRPRLAQMADDGNRLAVYMLDVVEDPHKLDTFVAACQLGITVSSLMVGFYGQARLLAFAQPWLERLGPGAQATAQSIAAVAILFLLTTLQVVLGELVPKNVGLQYPEKLATLTATPMRWSVWLFRPLIWLFNGSGRLVLRLIGRNAVAEHTHIHSPEEIVMLVEESATGGLLDAEERRLLVNTLQLRGQTASQVMIPRNHMLVGDLDESCLALFTMLARSPYSRLPLYEETIDNILGVVHLKDLMLAYRRHENKQSSQETDVRAIMRPALHLPGTTEIGDVLARMQDAHHNLAVVVDEYGGTAGMVTIEDLVEEIIGEFEDEFDSPDPPISIGEDGRIHVRGDVPIEDLNEALDLLLPSLDVHTVGGLILQAAGETPAVGDEVVVGETTFRIEGIYQHGIDAASFPGLPAQMERLS